ncbi:MAG: hypothetical protein HYW13_00555, partial [Planctomycetes bacterium]|nr:hypothetical protein [Planctomycetota bacterium]
MKDAIGFQDGFRLGLRGTASSRVQVEAIDQSTGNTLSVGGVSVVARQIMLTETGNSTGIFTAAGKVYGSSTAAILRGNIYVAGTSNATFMGMGGITATTTGRLSDGTYPYTGGIITLGSVTSNNLGTTTATSPRVSFKILEISASGRIGLIFPGTSTGEFGTATLAYQASTGAFTAASSAYGTSSWSGTRVVAVGTNSTAYGPPLTAGNSGSGTSNLLKLIDGSNYCLVQVGTYTAQVGPLLSASSTAMVVGQTFEGTIDALGGSGIGAGSITVTIGSFIVTGPRGSDSIKVSYLDEVKSTGTAGTVTSSTVFGTTGETGTLAVD